MQFGHEQLDVCRLSVGCAAWACALSPAACQVLSAEKSDRGKTMLVRIVSMLTKLSRCSHELREESTRYGDHDYDNDYDNDNGEDRKPQPMSAD